MLPLLTIVIYGVEMVLNTGFSYRPVFYGLGAVMIAFQYDKAHAYDIGFLMAEAHKEEAGKGYLAITPSGKFLCCNRLCRDFLPLLDKYSIIAPDVIGMPGKSAPYRNIDSKKDEYGLWIKEVLDHYKEDRISFVVSSYSSAMFLSFARMYPENVRSALLLVPSGIAHGSILPMLGKMVVPFMKYYFSPSGKTLDAVIESMGGKGDSIWREFFDIMMSSYKMEMRPPKEYKKREMVSFKAPLLIIASEKDIFFPAGRVFNKAGKIFAGPVTMVEIDSKHLPSDETMVDVCKRTIEFIENT
jgi:pimeloyl-ACP methyl ester carboxylesterase